MTIEEIVQSLRAMKYVVGVNQFVINEAIKALEQEPKTGHWIEHPHEAGPNWEFSRYECSECHDWEEDDSNYCPNCGAKMIEPQESEDKE